jgi:hypothetical protein
MHPRTWSFRILLLLLNAVVFSFRLIIKLLFLSIHDALPNPSSLLARFSFRAPPNCLALSKAAARYDCISRRQHEICPTSPICP